MKKETKKSGKGRSSLQVSSWEALRWQRLEASSRMTINSVRRHKGEHDMVFTIFIIALD